MTIMPLPVCGWSRNVAQTKVDQLIRSLFMSSQEVIHTIFIFRATNVITRMIYIYHDTIEIERDRDD